MTDPQSPRELKGDANRADWARANTLTRFLPHDRGVDIAAS